MRQICSHQNIQVSTRNRRSDQQHNQQSFKMGFVVNNNVSLTFSTSVNPLSLMLFPSKRDNRLLTTVLFSTSPSKRMKSMVLLEIRRAENCSGATMAFTLSITSQLEILLPGSLSWGRATLTVILAMGLRYRLYSEERHTASVVSWTMVVIVADIVEKAAGRWRDSEHC